MPKRAAAEVEMSLRQRLAAGEWRVSRRLPNERDLAQHYGVARNTVRSALDAIVAEGALVREVGRGTFLRGEAPLDLDIVMRRLVGVSPVDMMGVRMIFEPKAAALAAANATAGDLNAIVAAHEAAQEAQEMETFERRDADLHQRIFVATRNELMICLHDLLRLVRNQDLWLDIKRRSFSPARRRAYCDQHAAIVEALARRDGETAAAAMRAHLEIVARNLFNADASPAAAPTAFSLIG